MVLFGILYYYSELLCHINIKFIINPIPNLKKKAEKIHLNPFSKFDLIYSFTSKMELTSPWAFKVKRRNTLILCLKVFRIVLHCYFFHNHSNLINNLGNNTLTLTVHFWTEVSFFNFVKKYQVFRFFKIKRCDDRVHHLRFRVEHHTLNLEVV